MKTNQDRIYSDGIDWLAQNTSNDEPSSDAVRLLACLTDTAEEWVLQAVGHRQDEIAANDRKVQQAAIKPGERGFQPGCGCCAGPVEDRCCCHIHQDIPHGLRAHKCSMHQ